MGTLHVAGATDMEWRGEIAAMTISVIIAAGYPRPWRMRALLHVLSKQTRVPDEVIICDDTGLTPSPFGEMAAKVVCSGVPAGVNGVSRARNLGIEAAAGDLVLLLDDDSLPHPRCVEAHEFVQGLLAKEQPQYKFALLGQRDPEYEHLKLALPIGPVSPKAPNEYRGPLSAGNFISNNLSFPRQTFMDLGGFDEDYVQPDEYGWEDIELGIRWFNAGHQIAYTTDALVYHPEVPRTPEKQKRSDRAWLRTVSKHPDMARGG